MTRPTPTAAAVTPRTAMVTLLIAATAALAPAPATGQDLGLGVALADFEDFGLHARTLMASPLAGSHISAGGTYFTEGNYVTLDLDMHFRLRDREWGSFFPLLGVQLETDLDNADLGLNVGLGYVFGLTSQTLASLEGKMAFSDDEDFVLTATIFL